MDDQRIGAALRALRVRAQRRQSDVAVDAGVSTSTISRLERGHLDEMTVATIRAVAAVLEVRIELLPRSRNADLERVANAAHAALAEAVIAWLATCRASRHGSAPSSGWTVRPEMSFSQYGERGVIDLLAWHETTRSLLVIELKTDIVDVGELLGTLDRKQRNAHHVASGLGWRPLTVSALLVIAESDANRRKHARVRATFFAAFPHGVVDVRRWLRGPSGVLRGQVFFADRRRGQVTARLAAVRRVRRPRSQRFASAARTNPKGSG